VPSFQLTPYPAGFLAAEVNLYDSRGSADARSTSVAVIAALVRMREIPFRTAGKEGQALSVSPAFAPAVTKKALPSLL
jgi:hypothetical protein